MTDVTADRRLLIDADLTLSIDGVEARLVGAGSDLTLHTDEPARLTAALRRSGALSALRAASTARPYEAIGRPSLSVEGPRGAIVTITGDRARRRHTLAPPGTTVRIHRPFALIPPTARWAAALATVAALVVVVVRRRT